MRASILGHYIIKTRNILIFIIIWHLLRPCNLQYKPLPEEDGRGMTKEDLTQFSEAARADWELFLVNRAKELVTGTVYTVA